MAVSLSLAITQNSQSIENNKSNVTVTATAKWTYGSWNATGQCTGTITIDGTAYSFSGIKFNTSQTTSGSQVVMTKTVDVSHNSDGTKTLSCSASFVTGISSGTVSASASKALTTIARASQPSLVTWPESTANVGDFGETFSIHMNRKADTFTHTVRYEYGNRSGTIASGVATGTTWAVPLDFMNDIPNATSASGRIYVDTYSGSTLVGTRYTGFTVTVPASVKPTVTLSLDDITSIDGTYGSPVQQLSKIKATLSVTKAYGSEVDSYTIKMDGVTYNTATATSDFLKHAGGSVVTATVRDKRGRTGSVSYTMNVQAYELPNVTKVSVHRCDSDGTENAMGAYIKVTFSASVSAMDEKNTATYKVRYKKTEASTYTERTITALEDVYSVTNHDYIFAADDGSSYHVEVYAADRHGSAAKSTSASTAFTLFHCRADGTGIAFGKVSEKANTMEIALDAEFIGKVKGTIFDAIYPVGSIYLAYNHTDPATLFGGTWVRITNRFLWATTAGGTIGQTGGEQTVALTVDQIPAHTHAIKVANTATGSVDGNNMIRYNNNDTSYAGSIASNSNGGGEAHNNMPPYIQVSMWRRTA